MPDREKVIKGLAEMVDSQWLWNKADYWAMMCRDALELLKAQEPVAPIHYEAEGSYGCGACGELVGWDELDCCGVDAIKYRFCPGCGRKVIWDDD